MSKNTSEFQSAVAKLKLRWTKRQNDSEQELSKLITSKEEVLTRYQPVFSLDNIEELTADIYKSFLLFQNNRHWSGLHRVGGKATEDMNRLRHGLTVLLNEHTSLVNRLNKLRPKNKPPLVPYLGKAVITAILLVAFPEKYGVWNNTSESALKDLGIWPEFERGLSLGERYNLVNTLLLQLSEAVGVDLWTLDALFWGLEIYDANIDQIEVINEENDLVALQRFGLEKHLHSFLFYNWGSIAAFNDWQIYEEDGDIVGYEYNTGEVGKIDLLARHKTKNRWLIIELKRNQSSDQTIGQILRYMGWVSEKLADHDAIIEGLVISHTSDRRIQYALKHVQNVKHLLYEVQFLLKTI